MSDSGTSGDVVPSPPKHASRALATLTVALVVLSTYTPVGHATEPEIPRLAARSNDDIVTIEAESTPISAPPDATAPSGPEHAYVVWEAADCVTLAGADPHLDTWCTGPHDISLYEIACPTGTVFTWPLKTRTRPTGTTAWGPWRLLNSPCQPVTDDPTTTPEDPVAAELARQLTTLPIPPKRAGIAPVTTWFAVQTPMTLHTDAAPETLTTTVLGTSVDLELTPTLFTWDPGDGSAPIRTTRPGKPYPDQTTTHVYTKVGTYQVTLTTTWHGRYRTPDDTTWHDIAGTGTTTHTTAPFETREIRSVLSG